MTSPDPLAWRVAIALALALPEPPDWALWASGTADLEERKRRAYADEVKRCHAVGYSNDLADSFAEAASDEVEEEGPTPVPAPWDSGAYLADCARRGVESGPLPSLEWTAPDGFGWRVYDHGGGYIVVTFYMDGKALARIDSSLPDLRFYFTDDDYPGRIEHPLALVARIVTLATAAAKAMVP